VSVFTAFYDLESGPISYDFCTWLVRASLARDLASCSRLHVVIVPKEGGVGGFSRDWGKHDEASARWRLWHICVALCPLAGATVTVAATRKHAEAIANEPMWWQPGKQHFLGPLVDAARAGAKIPMLKATSGARRYVDEMIKNRCGSKPIVTLQLRNQRHDEGRNSDEKEWEKFYTWLIGQGYYVFLQRDTDDALKNGNAFGELDPDLRIALSERAVMNVCANTGPQEVLKFSHAPYLLIGQAVTDGWRRHFREHFHLNPDREEQVPWAGVRQRMVYRDDSFSCLKQEFERAIGLG
jgi:hypothetical protein